MSFLAALAALGLPWSSLTDCFVIVLDSIQSLPAFQTKSKPCTTDEGGGRKHDLTNKKTTTKTNTKTMTKTMTNTFREHLQRAIFDTFDL